MNKTFNTVLIVLCILNFILVSIETLVTGTFGTYGLSALCGWVVGALAHLRLSVYV